MELLLPAPPADAQDLKLAAEKADSLDRNRWVLTVYQATTAWIVAWMLRDTAPSYQLVAWAAIFLVLGWLFNARAMHLQRSSHEALPAAGRLREFAVGAFVYGSVWALGLSLLWPAGHVELQSALMLTMLGLATAATFGLNAHLPVYFAFVIPAFLGTLFFVAGRAGTGYTAMALFTVFFGISNALFAVLVHRNYMEALRRRVEVAALAADLRVQNEVALEASRDKSRFLAAASHDLRQPIHALALLSGALTQQELLPEGRRLAEHMDDTVQALGDMFNALLDLSRLDAQAVKPDLHSFDLQPLLARIAADEGLLAREKGLQLRLRVAVLPAQGECALAVRSDPILLDRILRNLVANAVCYTAHGGVLIVARRRGGHVTVRIIDTGIGIAPERQAEVFHEFVQVRQAGGDRNQGLGLGLAIVRRLVDLLGLTLRLRSTPGRGTAISLRLPLARSAVETLAAAALPMQALLAANPDDLVLVVDDDAVTRLGMRAMLRGWGFKVVAARGPDDFLPMLLDSTDVPCLLVCDCRRDGLKSGLDLVQRLQLEYNDEIPAILINGDDDRGDDLAPEARARGVKLLHRPVLAQAMRDAVGFLLATRERAS
jgi:signal transduction histidine kinase